MIVYDFLGLGFVAPEEAILEVKNYGETKLIKFNSTTLEFDLKGNHWLIQDFKKLPPTVKVKMFDIGNNITRVQINYNNTYINIRETDLVLQIMI